MAALEDIVTKKGETPEFIRCDNGPELTANALRDWCRFLGTGTSYIEPGSPWENPFVESFGSRLRDELLSVRHTARGAGLDRRLEARVQHLPAAQQSWLAIAGRLRYGLEGGEPNGPTLITGGPTSVVQSWPLRETEPRLYAFICGR